MGERGGRKGRGRGRGRGRGERYSRSAPRSDSSVSLLFVQSPLARIHSPAPQHPGRAVGEGTRTQAPHPGCAKPPRATECSADRHQTSSPCLRMCTRCTISKQGNNRRVRASAPMFAAAALPTRANAFAAAPRGQPRTWRRRVVATATAVAAPVSRPCGPSTSNRALALANNARTDRATGWGAVGWRKLGLRQQSLGMRPRRLGMQQRRPHMRRGLRGDGWGRGLRTPTSSCGTRTLALMTFP